MMSKAEKKRRHQKTKGYLLKQERKNKNRINKALWREIRLRVLERDRFSCQVCKKDLRKAKNQSVSVHHIIPRQYKELFFDEKNLITLCSHCHHWGKDSPHQNALFFSNWLKETKFEQWDYLMQFMGYEHIKNGKDKKKEKEESMTYLDLPSY